MLKKNRHIVELPVSYNYIEVIKSIQSTDTSA